MRLVATSVVRGARQGDSHGGVYLIDFAAREAAQVVDWNAVGIDWQGRGWDRGLRGVAPTPEGVLIAASDELFAFDREFRTLASWRSPHLKHCHEIALRDRTLFLTSTGYDSLLAFDLDRERFVWGLRLRREDDRIALATFDPERATPEPANAFHLNSVTAHADALYLAGLRTPGLMRFADGRLTMVATLPPGSHNAQPFGEGLLFNDTAIDTLRYVTRSRQRSFRVPAFPDAQLTRLEDEDGRLARRHFARGLCAVSDTLVAGGSSPSTVTLHDLAANRSTVSVALSHDVRNAIHGLAVWPH